MDDTISRQAAIDAVGINTWAGFRIKNLPSAQPEQTTQPNDSNTLNALDCISRQAAIDALIKWYGCEPSDIGAFENIIEKLPPEQPEQKSGTWIYDGAKRICPFCKDFIVTGRSIVKYCWNCGARLKERIEDAETLH